LKHRLSSPQSHDGGVYNASLTKPDNPSASVFKNNLSKYNESATQIYQAASSNFASNKAVRKSYISNDVTQRLF